MSDLKDFDITTTEFGSFWSPGNYKRTTRRLEDGEKLCKDLILMVQERANIEHNIAKQMKAWSNKWNSIIDRGPEYGSIEAAWKAVLVEADQRSELHLRVRENLLEEVVTSVKSWQKDNYHRYLLQLKEKKELDDQFRRAQKPWAKLLKEVEKTKTNYYVACKNAKTVMNQENNASKDSTLPRVQVQKLQDKASRCQEGEKKYQENYKVALLDLANYDSRYQEDMADVFDRCQRREGQRLQTFKDIFFSIHQSLNIFEDPAFPQIYRDFHGTVVMADHEKDLQWWSDNHGIDMDMVRPKFEEFTEECKSSAPKSRKSFLITDGNVTLTKQSPVSVDMHTIKINVKDDIARDTDNKSEEWNHPEDSDNVFEAEPGVTVRALYDYEGVEQDELSFKAARSNCRHNQLKPECMMDDQPYLTDPNLFLSTKQNNQEGGVYRYPCLSKLMSDSKYLAKIEAQAEKIHLPPAQEHLRWNMATFIVYSKSYAKEQSLVTRMQKVLGLKR